MKTRAELDAMSHQELKDYEQILLALWTPRMAIESDIERLSTNRNELLEIFLCTRQISQNPYPIRVLPS